MAVTHLRKVELVGKPHIVQVDQKQIDQSKSDQAQAHQARWRISNTTSAQHSLELRSLELRATAPHAARARALCLTRKHMSGIATMLRYLSLHRDHTLSSKLLGAGGLLGRITN